MSGEFSDGANGAATNGGSSAPSTPAKASSSGPPAVPKAVEDVLYSDIGVTTLLNRLKQSIASARDFALFLKKRSSLEESQAQGLKRLAKAHLDTIRSSEMKGGSYAQQLSEVIRVHERMGDNGMQFALSLHQMHEDLNELSNNMERGRKNWKHEGLESEKRASDAESLMQKAKAKYDSLAEDYDRARTGDTKGSRRIGLKGPKSAEQYEQDLSRKLAQADLDYEEKVKQAKAQRAHLMSTGRPQAVKALQELIKECDSALALQLQKFATFNEKLLLGNGLAVSPLSPEGGANTQRSMRDLIYDIDNEKDFHSYVASHAGKVPPREDEIKYEKHPTQMSKTQNPTPSSRQPSSTVPMPMPAQPQQLSQPTLQVNTNSQPNSQPTSMNSRYSTQPVPSYQQQQSPATQPASSTYSQQQAPYSANSATRDTYATPPYPTHPSERQSSYPQQQTTGSVGPAAGRSFANGALPSGNSMSPTSANLPPLKPVFGVSLEDLYTRDGSAVPLVVYQCMLAVDTFGLDVEGIYRISGTTSHVNQLRQMFDHDASKLDFRNPAAFYHDVSSVATLLKQFFRDLPDPLFTREHYDGFLNAARIDDETMRRDSLHQKINDLPDANYATLRAVILHLNRIISHESRNRMGSGNLAICFAPSLMGAHSGPQIADAGLQARVLDTILIHTTSIFDED